ncbi:UNVERIFIED_ORG: 4-carboxymuconolactone decarboxylase [Pantoea brenneri]|nr:4-carboxymuconolactone decarboxylase [Pantoea brenneri]
MRKSLDRETLAQRAPKLAELTQQVLFGDIWQRELLSTRERSLLTLATLTALGRVQQLPWHIDFARQNGLTQDESGGELYPPGVLRRLARRRHRAGLSGG